MTSDPAGSTKSETSSVTRAWRLLPAALVVAAVCALLVEVAIAFPGLIAQIQTPYSVNLWSDGPILVQVHRIALGTPPYRPLAQADSWIYGPVYPYGLAWIDRLFQRLPSIVSLRYISMVIGLVALVPLLYAVRIARRSALARPRVFDLLPLAFVGLAYLLLDLRSPTFVALHPDELSFLLIALAFAATFAYAYGPRSPLLLATLLALCLFDTFAKVNTAPHAYFFLAFLVIEGALAWRTALVWGAGFSVALALAYVALPYDVREWTTVIPAFHTFDPAGLVLYHVWMQWAVSRPFTGLLILATCAGAVFRFRASGARAAAAMVCVPLGIFATGMAAFASNGGGPNDLWPTYVALLVPLGALLDELTVSVGPAAITAGAFALALPASAALGIGPTIPLSPSQLAVMSNTSAYLARLCKPGHTIMLTWLVDPLLNCPGVRFTLWDSVGEIRWAQGGRFQTKTPFDGPIEPDAYVNLLEHSYTFARLRGNYRHVVLPIYDREQFSTLTYLPYELLHLDVWIKDSGGTSIYGPSGS